MGGHDYMGETVDEDVCGDFFDHIDDLLDFPEEEIEGIEGEEVGLENNWSNASNVLIDSNSLFPCNENQNTKDFLPTELAVPYEDIVQMEWLSNFVEDSFSAGSIGVDENVLATLNNNNAATKEPHQFTASSPVSVLESSSSSSPSSSSSSGNNSYCGTSLPLCAETFVPGRARTKRPRPPPISPRPNIQSSSPDTVLFFSTQPENFGDSDVPKDVDEKKKKKKKKNETFQDQLAGQQPTAVRKCLHCEITKTPQWRAGPLGPKTLCNACGVRYKSGRLFPEYRPAASPTFVPSLHSNSHKKVVEMRMMSAQKEAPPPEFVPINKHFLDYD